MIRLTRLNHAPLVLNSDLIEHIETTPDTVITLTTGQKIMVLESADDVVGKVVDFRRRIHDGFSCRIGQFRPVRGSGAVPEGEEEDRGR